MPDMLERLYKRLSAIAVTETAEDVFALVCQGVMPLGFNAIVLGYIEREGASHNQGFYFHHGVDDFLRIYKERGYRFMDAVAAHVAKTHRPFRWQEAYVDMTPVQIEQREVARSFHLNHGYVFPQMHKPGPVGFASIGRADDFDLDQDTFIELELTLRYAFDRIVAIKNIVAVPAVPSLTAREAAILSNVANGKTNWETGQILGISEYSVRDYMQTLSKRLGTQNRTHTVVRAIQTGLLLP